VNIKTEHTWDGFPVKHKPLFVRLNPGDGRVMMMEVSAPFFNDPPDLLGEPGQPFNALWDYEVPRRELLEVFFLNNITERYLEAELCPREQHLVFLLSGRKKTCGNKNFIYHSKCPQRDKMGRQSLSSLELFSTKCENIQLICNSWIKR
uniref:Uncharacterized protein n=1 Tax=Catagonus wagneri TaxID=51154 RepID=A0A8C3WHR4_9CETA